MIKKLVKPTYRPSDYWTSEIIKPAISEAVREHMVGRDEVAVFRLDVPKVKAYLKELILWIRILITTAFAFTLDTIVVWNFFAPTRHDVSDRVRDKVLNALNSEKIAGLVAEEDSGRFSTTFTIPPNSNTPEC